MSNIEGKRIKIGKYFLILFAFFIYSGTTVCAKYAALEGSITIRFIWFLGIEIFLLGIYAILWQQVLKYFSLVMAMSSKGIVVCFSLLWSVVLFEEKINLLNIVGICLIVFGIWRVSSDD